MRDANRLGYLVSLIAAAACGGGPPATHPQASRCVNTPIDTAWLRSGPVFTACDVDSQERVTTMTSVPPPNTGRTCFAAQLVFVVDTLGRIEPGTLRLVRATDPTYGANALRSAAHWRTTVARRAGAPVRQVVDVTLHAEVNPMLGGQVTACP